MHSSYFRLVTLILVLLPLFAEANPVAVATFDVDATPPLGSAMAYDTVKRIDELTLRCRGIVITGIENPIVLCAVDWIGIANEGHEAFRVALAAAAKTRPDHVAVHALHQHDAPGCDFTAERLLKNLGINGFERFNSSFQREVISRAATAITDALPKARPVSHWGWGRAEVRDIASARRILGPDGRVRATRYSATKDPAVRAEPVGNIDPFVSSISFWDGTTPVAVLTAYACHPQSYYRLGIPSPDFPGIARFIRGQDLPNTLHVHFNGAGGNVTAGKFNDGARENRIALATRLAEGMRSALANTEKHPLDEHSIGWASVPVLLPVAPHLNRESLIQQLRSTPPKGYVSFADQLAWLERSGEGKPLNITCLKLGSARMIHLPGELFVEYQIAAQKMRDNGQVMLAAYGDYGPAYIGTAASYEEGGYETSPGASNVAPASEKILLETMQKLLAD
jgi:hypothetical protein